jgi:hypothetical protein
LINILQGFFDQTFENGWAQINITSYPVWADSLQMYAAGYLEGYLTQKNIFNFYPNQFQVWGFNGSIPHKMYSWMSENLNWTRAMVAKSPSDPYWQSVGLVLSQFDGLVAGYASAAPNSEKLSAIELYFLNAAGDLEDLIPAIMDPQENGITRRVNSKLPRNVKKDDGTGDDLSDCSALIKITNDYSDIFAGHTTWRSFGIINKMYKFVNLKLHNNSISVSYASSPGFLSSKDDFYITSNNLVVMETTNSIFNSTLYRALTTQSVLCWIRSIVANQLARNGAEWTELFAKYNSGSYNNQFMVIDYKKFVPNKKSIAPGTLWILEQLPGLTQRDDVSAVLASQGFWSSYNIPYFSKSKKLKSNFNSLVYNLAGYPERKQKYGDDYDYKLCPRSKIFEREQKGVDSLKAFGRVLQYNQWQTDPFSSADPGKSISSRYDLRKINPHAFGGIDSKITSYERVPKLSGYGICGPTHQDQEPFKWSDPRWANVSHKGQPDTFNFDWIELTGKF